MRYDSNRRLVEDCWTTVGVDAVNSLAYTLLRQSQLQLAAAYQCILTTGVVWPRAQGPRLMVAIEEVSKL